MGAGKCPEGDRTLPPIITLTSTTIPKPIFSTTSGRLSIVYTKINKSKQNSGNDVVWLSHLGETIKGQGKQWRPRSISFLKSVETNWDPAKLARITSWLLMTKYLDDGLVKMPKALKDILSMLVKVNPGKVNELVTVGYLIIN
ncbi:hypothetical protein BC941DRAFT_467257 [Chlamydoabsidia padenii]|nr:hypothetical protein BC941DRAFT_467257 [Chlamydoabsidia padenii]